MYWQAEIRRSYDVALRWAAWAERSQSPRQVWAACAWLAWLHASRGAFVEAEQALEQAQPFLTATDELEPSDLLRNVRGWLAFQREEYAVAGQAFKALLVKAIGMPPQPTLPGTRRPPGTKGLARTGAHPPGAG